MLASAVRQPEVDGRRQRLGYGDAPARRRTVARRETPARCGALCPPPCCRGRARSRPAAGRRTARDRSRRQPGRPRRDRSWTTTWSWAPPGGSRPSTVEALDAPTVLGQPSRRGGMKGRCATCSGAAGTGVGSTCWARHRMAECSSRCGTREARRGLGHLRWPARSHQPGRPAVAVADVDPLATAVRVARPAPSPQPRPHPAAGGDRADAVGPTRGKLGWKRRRVLATGRSKPWRAREGGRRSGPAEQERRGVVSSTGVPADLVHQRVAVGA